MSLGAPELSEFHESMEAWIRSTPAGDDLKFAWLKASVTEPGSEGLRAWRDELDRRRTLATEIRSALPGLDFLKGPVLEELYPRKWIRPYSDFDLLAPAERDFWRGLLALVGDGWRLRQLMLTRHGTKWQLGAQLTELDGRSVAGTSTLDADLTTFLSFDGPDAEIDIALGSIWVQMVAVCDELRQRPMSLRDVVDLAVLLNDAEQHTTMCVRALQHYGLTSQWNQLRRSLMPLSALKHVPAAFLTFRILLDFARSQLAALRRSIGGGVDLLSWLMRRAAARANSETVSGALGRGADSLAIFAMQQRVVYPMRFVTAIDWSESLRLVRDSRGLFVTTPIGRFSIC